MLALTLEFVAQKNVLLRLDLDLPETGPGQFDTTRLDDSLETIALIYQAQAKHVTVLAHRGRPEGADPNLSLQPIAELLYAAILKHPSFAGLEDKKLRSWLNVRENLRFDPREEQADPAFARELVRGQNVFVNDAFATAHRKHTSMVLIPQFIPSAMGLRFAKEIEALQKVTLNPERPVVFILGGAKLETKLPLIERVSHHVDQILLGGKLALEAQESAYAHPKVLIAQLTPDTLDISDESIVMFTHLISTAKTIIWNGPMGKFEDGHMAGTQAVAQAIAASQSYSLIGGGDTEAAVTALQIDQAKAFDHVSTGGGAMMAYLAEQTLPALEALEASSAGVAGPSVPDLQEPMAQPVHEATVEAVPQAVAPPATQPPQPATPAPPTVPPSAPQPPATPANDLASIEQSRQFLARIVANRAPAQTIQPPPTAAQPLQPAAPAPAPAITAPPSPLVTPPPTAPQPPAAPSRVQPITPGEMPKPTPPPPMPKPKVEASPIQTPPAQSTIQVPSTPQPEAAPPTGKVTFGINGFGRIGRTAFRVWWMKHRDRIDLKVINTSGSMDIDDWAMLLKYDSNYGPFAEPITFDKVHPTKEVTDQDPVLGTLKIGDRSILVTAQRDPAKIPWGANGVDTVIESTGVFISADKAQAHITGGAKKVIISAPPKGPNVPTTVISVKEAGNGDQIISNASCTTNCIAPVVQVISSAFGVAKASMTTIHSYTDDQNLHDNSHKDLRRARAAAINIVPTSTGAAVATTEVIPELKGLFHGLAIRVPTPVGSLSDIVFITKQKTTVEQVNDALTNASKEPRYAGILAVTSDPIVSSDIKGRSESSIVDLSLTQVIDGDLVKVIAWYDNEFGYCNRLVEQIGRQS